MLIPERPNATRRPQRDLLAATFQFQRVTRL
jgi:hypothetical protein